MPRIADTDTKAWDRAMSSLATKVLPRAVSDTLDLAAKTAQKLLPEAASRTLDRPTSFTQRAWGVRLSKSTDAEISSSVFAKPQQDRYLQYVIFGGARHAGDPGAGPHDVPLPGIDGRLSAAGGVPRSYAKKLSTELRQEKEVRGAEHGDVVKGGLFFGTLDGLRGYWRRPKRKKLKGPKRRGVRRWANIGEPKLLLRFDSVTKHKPLFRKAYDQAVNQAMTDARSQFSRFFAEHLSRQIGRK